MNDNFIFIKIYNEFFAWIVIKFVLNVYSILTNLF